MERVHLSSAEVNTLDGFAEEGRINENVLPVGLFIGLDSMGPMRDPITDKLFPGIQEMLAGSFSDMLRDYGNILVVATNGPDIEGEDILRALSLPVAAFAVTEGGGKLLALHSSGRLETVFLADEQEVTMLHQLEEKVKQNPIMQLLLEDKELGREHPPIRTPYDTNIVLTLPADFGGLPGDEIEPYLDLYRDDYVDILLRFAHEQFTEAIDRLGLADSLGVLVKKQNRRIYVMPKHIFDGDLSKSSGASVGSMTLSLHEDYQYPRWRMENTIYVADKAIDVTSEGQKVIGASERSMITGGLSFLGDNKPGPEINVVELMRLGSGPYQYLAEVSARLAVNITMDGSEPSMERVENVPILHIGSGLKALDALSHFYRRIHG